MENQGTYFTHHHQQTYPGLPPKAKARLYSLFKELEKEFDALYMENASLRHKVSELEKGGCFYEEDKLEEPDDKNNVLKSFTKNTAFKTRHKLKAHTSKIVSSFKTPSVSCSLIGKFKAHRDGLWDVDVSCFNNFPVIGTASVDKTARVWSVESGKCLLTYDGHEGSVNGISFHPNQDLVMTASGDGTAHVWRRSIGNGNPSLASSSNNNNNSNNIINNSSNPPSGYFVYSSGDDSESSDEGLLTLTSLHNRIVKNPVTSLTGHSGTVISCQWFGDSQAVTASWDRTGNLYDINAGGVLIQTLAGHDDELTHVTCHPTKRLIATSSRDSTFRLWDFRETIHSVSVFQGHTESVTCAVFARSDQIVSGSDDRSVKVWDLRNMRAPTINIQTSSPVNRLSVSSSGIIAIPHDNRHIVLYDLNTPSQKLLRLPREFSKSHHRLVTAAKWACTNPEMDYQWKCKANLFTTGFDRLALGWCIKGVPSLSAKEDLSRDMPGFSGGSTHRSHKIAEVSKSIPTSIVG
ncbi:WD repeat-containing protein 37 [Lepeophtheirus salmonis]|nr:WD repeat-containing protein 37-like [Lepeophtheirus salmonis]XP_040582956.1 WD repeat-containing protein 37-like [Lepeophtheirus salmonis]XP_040582958.1 WD repeat-containing protein 37-like [Lepeophtheirus salmonis]